MNPRDPIEAISESIRSWGFEFGDDTYPEEMAQEVIRQLNLTGWILKTADSMEAQDQRVHHLRAVRQAAVELLNSLSGTVNAIEVERAKDNLRKLLRKREDYL